jgi:hypothetical protein
MSRDLSIKLAIGALLAALGVWFAFSTHWETATVPEPMKGEALRNPYYALVQFAASLGLHTQEISTVHGLATDAVLILAEPGDAFTRPSADALENWVEAGGRLVIEADLLESYPMLQTWSGIKPVHQSITPPAPGTLKSTPVPKPPAPERKTGAGSDASCPLMPVSVDGSPTGQSFRACNAASVLRFDGDRAPAWTLADDRGLHVIRTGMGLGEITVLGPRWILMYAGLKRADHAEMLAAATGLRHDDTLLIFHPGRAEPLLKLLWRLAAPGIPFLLCGLLALAWRHGPRFGPPLPVPTPVRRSLAEQIRANARFAWRTRKLAALHTAVRRSLDQAAARQIEGYNALDDPRRAERLAACTGLDATAIGAARSIETSSRLNEGRAAITLMEVCRRILLKMQSAHQRPSV